jgi:hypothetical protein
MGCEIRYWLHVASISSGRSLLNPRWIVLDAFSGIGPPTQEATSFNLPRGFHRTTRLYWAFPAAPIPILCSRTKLSCERIVVTRHYAVRSPPCYPNFRVGGDSLGTNYLGRGSTAPSACFPTPVIFSTSLSAPYTMAKSGRANGSRTTPG